MKKKILDEKNIELIKDRIADLCELRKVLKITQTEIAEFCNCTQRLISYLENGLLNNLALFFRYRDYISYKSMTKEW